MRVRRDADVWKGLLAGLAGGLAAAWVMNQFQSALGRLLEGDERPHGAQAMQRGAPAHGAARELQKRGADEPGDDATERVANIISTEVSGRALSAGEKREAGALVHYAFGVTTGAAYGALAEVLPWVAAGGGAPFGALVWVGADEGVVPALGLSKSPAEYPLSVHAYALASHVVFGLTAEAVRRGVRRAL